MNNQNRWLEPVRYSILDVDRKLELYRSAFSSPKAIEFYFGRYGDSETEEKQAAFNDGIALELPRQNNIFDPTQIEEYRFKGSHTDVYQ